MFWRGTDRRGAGDSFFFFFFKDLLFFSVMERWKPARSRHSKGNNSSGKISALFGGCTGGCGGAKPSAGEGVGSWAGEESFAQVHGGGFQRHLEGLLGDFQGDRKPLAAGRGGTAGTPTHPPTHPGIRMPRHLNETLEATT